MRKPLFHEWGVEFGLNRRLNCNYSIQSSEPSQRNGVKQLGLGSGRRAAGETRTNVDVLTHYFVS